MPEGVTTIGKEAFAYNRLTSVVIPYGVTTIDDEAFYSNIQFLSGFLTCVRATGPVV
ncbi:MAG: leucine-rich repeat domain-containing protein [Treponema sp.]|nr:leucine-rich repeat domain-containing protein [Treponema sp.]